MSVMAMLPAPFRSAIETAKTPQSRRWIALVVLLVVEATVLSIRFDAGTADVGSNTWGHFFSRYFRYIPQVGIVTTLSSTLVCWVWLRDDLVREVSAARYRRVLKFMIAQVTLFFVFSGFTWKVIEGGIDESGIPLAWLVAWGLSGLALIAVSGLVAFSPRFWLIVLRRGSPFIMLGLGYALVAVFLSRYAGKSWRILAEPSFWAMKNILGFIYSDVVFEHQQFEIGTSRFKVSIAAACSGYQGIGLILTTLLFFLVVWRSRLRFPQALLLLPLGITAMAGSNVIRMTTLIIVGTSFSPQVALGGFHSQVGWLMFVSVMSALVVMADRVRFFSKAPAMSFTRPDPTSTGTLKYRLRDIQSQGARSTPTALAFNWRQEPITAYLAPMVVLVLTMMITNAFTSGFDWGYPIRVLTTGVVLFLFRAQYRKLAWDVSPSAVAAGVGVFALWIFLEPEAETPEAGRLPETLSLASRWLWIAARVIGSVIIVPMAEELAFRGFLPRRLMEYAFEKVPFDRFDWPAFLCSSVVFGILHERWFAGTLAGMVYYLAMVARGRLSDAILAHAVTNALIAAMVLLTDSWYLWS